MKPPADQGLESSPPEKKGRFGKKLMVAGAALAALIALGLVVYLAVDQARTPRTTTAQATTTTTAPPRHDPTVLIPMWRAVEHLEAVYGERIIRQDLARAARVALEDVSADLNPVDLGEPIPDDVLLGFEGVWRAWRLIELKGLEEDPRKLVVQAIEAMVETTGDPEAAVLVDVEVQSDGYVEDAFYGIGAFVVPVEGFVVISQPFPGGPASKAGIRPGDVVIEVDGVSVAGMDINEVVDRVRGPAGTTVSLVLERAGTDPVRVEVTRETLKLGTARFDMHPDGIGYLAVTSLEARTPAEAQDHLRQLMRRDTRALILDLRGNSGGRPSAAVAVADMFLDVVPVFLEEKLDGATTTHEARAGGLALDIPMVILVDNATAGEAELLAGALRHHERGVLFGLPSAGQTTLHKGHELGNGVVLVIRSGRWLLPNGESVGPDGLVPDEQIGLTPEDISAGFDRPQAAANAYLWTLLQSASEEDGTSGG